MEGGSFLNYKLAYLNTPKKNDKDKKTKLSNY